MNLIWFLTIGLVISILTGELTRFSIGPLAVRLSDFMAALVAVFVLVWQIGIQKKLIFPKSLKWLGLFCLIGLGSLVWSGELGGWLFLARFVIYSSILWIGFLLIKSRVIALEKLYLLLGLGGVVIAITGFVQLIIWPDLTLVQDLGYDAHQNRLTSTFLDPNFAGAFLVISLVVLIYLWLKQQSIKLLVGGVIVFIAIVLTFSRSAYLMLAVGLMPFLIKYLPKFRFKFKVAYFLAVGFIVGFLVINLPRITERISGGLNVDESASERFFSWGRGWEAVKSSPVVGVGFDNLAFYFSRNNLTKVYSVDGGNSKNGVDSSLLFVMATTGLVGLIIYLIWIGSLLKNFDKKESSLVAFSLVVALLCDSQFVNSMFFPAIMVYLNLILGANLVAEA